MPDIIWCQGATGKLFHQSGDFTTTVKASITTSILAVSGITTDGYHVIYSDDTNNIGKLYYASGIFSSTIRDSLSGTDLNWKLDNPWTKADARIEDVDWDGDNTIIVSNRDLGKKLMRISGRFSNIVNNSISVASFGLTPSGVCTIRDEEQRVETLYSRDRAGNQTDVYRLSGQFTLTVHSSLNQTVVINRVRGVSYDGVDGLMIGVDSGVGKVARVSGAWSTTVRDSLALESGKGICTTRFGAA